MGEYKFSGVVDKNKVFIINHSEITERIDPIYFKSVNELVIVKNTTNPVFKLSEVVNMKRGRFGHRPRNDPKFYNGEYPFIQTGDIVKASKKGGQIPYSQTLNELGLKTSRLFEEKAIIITIAANIGDTAILDYPACFPDSLIAMTPKEEDKLQLEYLNVYFKFLKNYLNDLAPQAAQKNINYQQLAPTPIVVPTIEIQKEIVTLYKNAYTSKQLKEKEAKNILASVDTYLLNELGITLPVMENTLESRVFTVNFSEVSGERLDAFAVLNKDYKIEGGKYENFRLRQIADVQKGQSITSAKIIDGDYPVIAGGQSSPYSHNIYNYENNAITVSASGAYAGYVWYHNTPIFASDCSVIQSKDENNISTLFLSEVLKTKQKEIYNLQQGAGQPHVYSSDLIKLNIPVPPKEKQEEIINHISEIRTKAKQLKKEAKTGLENAKQEIEKLILGTE